MNIIGYFYFVCSGGSCVRINTQFKIVVNALISYIGRMLHRPPSILWEDPIDPEESIAVHTEVVCTLAGWHQTPESNATGHPLFGWGLATAASFLTVTMYLFIDIDTMPCTPRGLRHKQVYWQPPPTAQSHTRAFYQLVLHSSHDIWKHTPMNINTHTQHSTKLYFRYCPFVQ